MFKLAKISSSTTSLTQAIRVSASATKSCYTNSDTATPSNL